MIDVELREATKTFGDVTAVDHLSFKAKKGEFLSLLGPSGCGKTTTIRLITGLEKLTKGFVLIKGEVVNDKPPYMRNTAMVFQNYALFPHMSVYKNIAFGLKYREYPKEEVKKKVAEMLEFVELPGLGNRYPRQLSGGQQQRVALARALIIEPDVLLLDEPLSNLDAKLRLSMRVELKKIQRKAGTTTIYVTHDQDEAMALSDKIIVMDKGSKIEEGTPYELYESPKSMFVADFIGQSNFFEGKVSSVEDSEATIVTKGGLKVSVLKQYELTQGKTVLAFIRAERIEITMKKPIFKKNVFQGRVMDAIYLGRHNVYKVRLESDDLLTVIEQTVSVKAPFRKDTNIWVKVKPEDIGILAKK